MRIIKKCRRTLRDERAGLVFRWRVPDGSKGRTLVAALLTVLLFLGVAWSLEVRGKSVRIVSRETSRLIVLRPQHDEGARALLGLARQYSPFADLWEPGVEEALRGQMARLDAEVVERSRYRPLLRSLPAQETEFPLPELFDPVRPSLPPVARTETLAAARSGVESRILAEATGDLEIRWGQLSAPLVDLLEASSPGKVPDYSLELLGSERRFLLGANPAGEVIFCQALDDVENKRDDPVAHWLRRHHLEPDPAAEGEVWGIVRVLVQAVPAREQDEEAP